MEKELLVGLVGTKTPHISQSLFSIRLVDLAENFDFNWLVRSFSSLEIYIAIAWTKSCTLMTFSNNLLWIFSDGGIILLPVHRLNASENFQESRAARSQESYGSESFSKNFYESGSDQFQKSVKRSRKIKIF